MRPRPHRLPLAIALAFAGCASGIEDTAELIASGIINGTRNPRLAPLTPGQQLAIGWLHAPGAAGEPFCSAALVHPRVVATAKHCVEGQDARSISFAIGLTPADVIASFPVAGVHVHPRVDAALLVLDLNAIDDVPALETIAISVAPLDERAAGVDVEVAGYGQTNDPDRWGRYFAVVPVDRIDAEFIVVSNARANGGACFGDSGGPVLAVGPGGLPVLLAVVTGGAESCLEDGWFTRLDPLADWIGERLGEALGAALPPPAPGGGGGGVAPGDDAPPPPADGKPPPAAGEAPEAGPGPDPEACGDLGFHGRCDGGTAVWCDAGKLQRLDCAERGERCLWLNEKLGFFCEGGNDPGDDRPAEPPADPGGGDGAPGGAPPPDIDAQIGECGRFGPEGACDGDDFVWCEDGALERIECAFFSAVCEWFPPFDSFGCVIHW